MQDYYKAVMAEMLDGTGMGRRGMPGAQQQMMMQQGYPMQHGYGPMQVRVWWWILLAFGNAETKPCLIKQQSTWQRSAYCSWNMWPQPATCAWLFHEHSCSAVLQ